MNRFLRSRLQPTLWAVGVFWLCTQHVPGRAEGVEPPPESSELLVRHAEVFLQLQRVKLRQATELNQRVKNTISQQQLNNLRLGVALAEELVEDAREGDSNGREPVYLRMAQNAVDKAETELAQATAVRSKGASSLTETDMELLRLQVELAKLNLDLGRRAFATTRENQLQWKVDILYDELSRLRSELNQIRRRP